MLQSPFQLLRPFEEVLDVQLLTRADNVHTDEQALTLLGAERMATTKQIHGNRTIVVTDESRRDEEADGMITDEIGLTLAIRAADCQIFGVYEPRMHVAGVLHAGWRGLLAGAIPAFISAFSRAHRVSPAELLVVAGPSLCQQCAQFTDPLKELRDIDPKFFDGQHVNLQGIADDQLFSLGIAKDHFERHQDCTRCNPQTYRSYRSDPESVKQGFHNVLALTLK